MAQSHKSLIEGGFQYKLNNGACMIKPYPTVEVKHIWQVYVASVLVVLFLYYMHHGMNIYSCEKQIFKSFGCTKICNGSKWTKTSRNEVMQPTISNNDSRPIFSYNVHSQAGFDNLFISGLIYLGISKMSFSF